MATGGTARAAPRIAPASAATPRRAATTPLCPTSRCARAMPSRDRAGASQRRDARPYLEPSLLRARRGEDALLGRPCDGLVDERHRAARRRHGRLHALAQEAAAARGRPLLADARPLD